MLSVFPLCALSCSFRCSKGTSLHASPTPNGAMSLRKSHDQDMPVPYGPLSISAGAGAIAAYPGAELPLSAGASHNRQYCASAALAGPIHGTPAPRSSANALTVSAEGVLLSVSAEWGAGPVHTGMGDLRNSDQFDSRG
jgi:hypothetical protein